MASVSPAVRAGRVDWTTLWLPLEARGPVWVATALVAAYHLATMSRDLSFYDSAELAMVAVQAGLSHPPGHPLHALLGWLVSHVPGVPPLIGLNALSALPAALAVVPVCSLAGAMAGPAATDEPRWFRRRHVVPALAAVFAIHPALWEPASRVEVYALASFLALWAIARLDAQLSGAATPTRRGGWLAAGVALGLCASANPIVATVAAAAISPALLESLIRRRARWTALGLVVAGGLSGLLPYVYVPLVAGRTDVLVWGAPTHGEALRRYLTGADFAHNNQWASWAMVGRHALDWAGWAVENGLLPLIGLGLLAHLALRSELAARRALAPIGLGLVVFFIVRNVVFFPQVSDYLGYLMVPLALLSAGVGALVARIGAGGARRSVLAAVLALVLVAGVAVAEPGVLGRTRHRDRVARVLARGALELAPRRAVIIASSDHWVFPLLYLQEVEALRLDVVVLLRGLSGASWYWAHLQRRHPDLSAFAVRGPGGQPARIRRFLEANSDRPVLYEDWLEATSIGREPGCVGAWLLADRDACGAAPPVDEITPALERALDVVGGGSPTTDAVIANVSLARGEELWRAGRSDEALRALRAGVPRPLRPALGDRASAAVTVLRGPLPPLGTEAVAIGHCSRNLVLAAHLLAAGGAEADARAHAAAAARAGATPPSPAPRARER
jgi:hypothetical protein